MALQTTKACIPASQTTRDSQMPLILTLKLLDFPYLKKTRVSDLGAEIMKMPFIFFDGAASPATSSSLAVSTPSTSPTSSSSGHSRPSSADHQKGSGRAPHLHHWRSELGY